jgi:hypothetical protein
MTAMIFKTLWMFGLAIIVSLLIAAIIKVIVVVLSRIERTPAPTAPRAPLAKPAAQVPAEHIAVIAAAAYAVIGAHRILRIEAGRRSAGWAGEGRLAHHASHAVRSSHPKR